MLRCVFLCSTRMDSVFTFVSLACVTLLWISSLILRDINDHWLLTPVIILSVVEKVVCVCVCLYVLLTFWFCWHEIIYLLWFHAFIYLCSLWWSLPSNAFCKTGSVDRYWWNLTLSWNVLFCPCMDWKVCWDAIHGLLDTSRHLSKNL